MATGQRTVDFGYFRCGKGKRYLLSWHDDGRLVLDGDVISWIATEEEARKTLDGWYDNCDRPNALVWLAGRLATIDSPGWAQ